MTSLRGMAVRTASRSRSDGALLDGAGVLLPAYGYVWLTV